MSPGCQRRIFTEESVTVWYATLAERLCWQLTAREQPALREVVVELAHWALGRLGVDWSFRPMTALQPPDAIHLPGFLIIDSPRKNFWSGQADRGTGPRIYSLIEASQAANGSGLQMLIADNDLARKFHRSFRVVTLSYDDPLLNAIKHPGKDQVQTLDSQIEAERVEGGRPISTDR
jgi:hypothetical protein